MRILIVEDEYSLEDLVAARLKKRKIYRWYITRWWRWTI